MTLVRGEPWQLPLLAEHLRAFEPDFEACWSASRLGAASEGALVLCGLDEEGARWLNLHRNAITARRLRLVLWMPRRFSMRAVAPDLDAWTRVIADLPPAPPTHAVEACAAAPAGRVRWEGPDLDRVAAAAWPSRPLVRIHVVDGRLAWPSLGAGDIPVVVGLNGQRPFRDLLWLLAERRTSGPVVLWNPDVDTPGYTLVSARVSSWEDAAARLGNERDAALAGLAPAPTDQAWVAVDLHAPSTGAPDVCWTAWAHACLDGRPTSLPTVDPGIEGLGVFQVTYDGHVVGRSAIEALTAVLKRWPDAGPDTLQVLAAQWARWGVGPVVAAEPAYPRYWIPRGGPVTVREGFLDLATDARETLQLVDAPVQVLLGEPGMGKSTELRRLTLATAARNPDDAVRLVDLRRFGSHDTLHRALGALPPPPPGRRAWLLFDAFDECRLHVQTLGDLLDDTIRARGPDRVVVRIACRAGVWPTSLEGQLAATWRPVVSDPVEVLELLPLRRQDVGAYVDATGRDGAAFVNAMGRAELGALAARPITLKLLLASSGGGTVPVSRTDLFVKGMHVLVSEPNDRRRDQAHDPAQVRRRLAAAGRIATVMLLGGFAEVSLEPGDPSPGVLTIGALRGPEADRAGGWQMDEGDLDDAVRNTALFSWRGSNRGFDHHTFAEYLAARHLVDHGFTGSAAVALLWPEGHSVVAPHLHGLAAWLASIDTKARAHLVEQDPLVLLKADPSALDDPTRALLVACVLRSRATGQIAEDLESDLRWFRHLAHPGLEDQLHTALADKPDPAPYRVALLRTAAHIARQTGVRSLVPRLLELSLDPAEDHGVRVAAAEAAKELDAPPSHVEAWLRLSRGQAGPDPYHELRGVALLALWPARRDLVDLAGALDVDQSTGFYGMFQAFVGSVPPRVLPDELPGLLRLFGRRPRAVGFGRHEPWAQIFEAAWRELPTHEEVRHAFVDCVFELSARDETSIRSPESAESRRALVRELLSDPRSTSSTLWKVSLILPGIVLPGDLAWAIDGFRSASNDATRDNYLDATRLAYRGDLDQIEALRAACAEMPMLQARWAPILDRPVEVPHAAVERPAVDPPPAQRVTERLRGCEGDPAMFPDLLRQLTLRPQSTRYGSPFERPISDLPGWQAADAATRARILACAERFLDTQEPNRPPDAAPAGLQAAVLVQSERGTALPAASPRWGVWAATFLRLHLVRRGREVGALVADAAREAPGALRDGVALLLSRSTTDHDYEQALTCASMAWSQGIAALVLSEVQRSDLPHLRRALALKCWLEHDEADASTIAGWTFDPTLPVELRTVAATYQFRHLGDTLPDDWWARISAEVQFAHAVAARLDVPPPARSRSRMPRAPVVADLFLWLTAGRDPDVLAGLYGDTFVAVSPEQQLDLFRARLPRWLATRAEPEDVAALERIARAQPALRYLLEEAQTTLLTRTWRPRSPQEILDWLRVGPTERHPDPPPPAKGTRVDPSLPDGPFALVSYRHESPAHVDAVGHLVADLRAAGLRVVVDTDHTAQGGPREGWTSWMEHAVARASCIVTIWSPGYRASWDSPEPGSQGLGVAWEARQIRAKVYQAGDLRPWVAVVLDPSHRNCVLDIVKMDSTVHSWPAERTAVIRRVAAAVGAPAPAPIP